MGDIGHIGSVGSGSHILSEIICFIWFKTSYSTWRKCWISLYNERTSEWEDSEEFCETEFLIQKLVWTHFLSFLSVAAQRTWIENQLTPGGAKGFSFFAPSNSEKRSDSPASNILIVSSFCVKLHTINHQPWHSYIADHVIHLRLPPGEIDLRGWSGNIGDGPIKVGFISGGLWFRKSFYGQVKILMRKIYTYSIIWYQTIFSTLRGTCILETNLCVTMDLAMRRLVLPAGHNSPHVGLHDFLLF